MSTQQVGEPTAPDEYKAEREARLEARRLEVQDRLRRVQDRLRRDVEGKRFRLVRRCECPPDDMGWGCCCSQPIGVVEDPNGDYVVTPYVDGRVAS